MKNILTIFLLLLAAQVSKAQTPEDRLKEMGIVLPAVGTVALLDFRTDKN